MSKKNDNFIRIKKLSKIYKLGEVQVKALDDISLNIKTGEITVIVGPSGSGKTTLLNMIGGIDSPTKGYIAIDREKIESKSQTELTRYRRDNIGFIFQFFNLIPNLTAGENIEFIYSYVYQQKPKNSDKKVRTLLEKVGLEKRAGHFPYQLSGGEQQRVAIARALAKDPKIMLADEPTGDLDHKTGLKILEVLSSLASENKAVIVVTHDRELEKIAHHIIRLRDGKVQEDIVNEERIAVKELD
jgi:putative ABC transport system ATP-binding protein